MPDKQLTCVDCSQDFSFSEGEQRFYAEREYTEPKRCKPCRERRKAEKQVRVVNQGGYPPPPEFVDGGEDTVRYRKGKRGRREH